MQPNRSSPFSLRQTFPGQPSARTVVRDCKYFLAALCTKHRWMDALLSTKSSILKSGNGKGKLTWQECEPPLHMKVLLRQTNEYVAHTLVSENSTQVLKLVLMNRNSEIDIGGFSISALAFTSMYQLLDRILRIGLTAKTPCPMSFCRFTGHPLPPAVRHTEMGQRLPGSLVDSSSLMLAGIFKHSSLHYY